MSGPAGQSIEDSGFVKEIPPKAAQFSEWYTAVVLKAELADYSPVRGCIVVRPYGYAIWELMQQGLDGRFKATGHVNAYFPLFIPQSFFAREAEHVEGFAPEVAWVTRGGGEELAEPLAVRPTSETIIGHMYARWIKSYRDLPVLINQWGNVVRWEKATRPFLRTMEFLWQEGHTAHRTAEEAEAEARQMLEVYRDFAETDLGDPRPVGAEAREREVPGRAAVVHDRGADAGRPGAPVGHVARPRPELRAGVRHQVPRQRQHGEACAHDVLGRELARPRRADHGARGRPRPRAAAAGRAVSGRDRADPGRQGPRRGARGRAGALPARSTRAGVRVRLDDRTEVTPGYKFNDWEMRGVPLRLELGPRDLAQRQAVLVPRVGGAKRPVPLDGIAAAVADALGTFGAEMFRQAKAYLDAHVVVGDDDGRAGGGDRGTGAGSCGCARATRRDASRDSAARAARRRGSSWTRSPRARAWGAAGPRLKSCTTPARTDRHGHRIRRLSPRTPRRGAGVGGTCCGALRRASSPAWPRSGCGCRSARRGARGQPAAVAHRQARA